MMRMHLESLAQLLRQHGEIERAAMVEAAITGTEAALAAFLVSNELWGGSGSIADCAGGAGRSERRLKIEDVLVQLGSEQMRSGSTNPRTEMWVTAFTAWKETGT